MPKAAENRKDPIGDALEAVRTPANPTPTKSEDAPVKAIAPAVKPAANTAPAPAAPKLTKKLPNARIQVSGYLHNKWDVTADRGTLLEDVLNPDYWTHVASQFKPQDQIEVLCEDGSWYARLIVINADRLWAKCYKLEFHDLTTGFENMPSRMEEDYVVDWNAIGRYFIYKKSQRGEPPLKDGFETRLEAYQWLDGHLKSIKT